MAPLTLEGWIMHHIPAVPAVNRVYTVSILGSGFHQAQICKCWQWIHVNSPCGTIVQSCTKNKNQDSRSSNRIKTAPPRIVSPASVATDALQLLELLVDRHPHNAARYVCSCGGVNMVSMPRIRSCSGSAARREMMHRSVLNMFAAKPMFDRARSQLKFRGDGGFDPSWREVNVNKPFNIFVQRGWGIWSLMKSNVFGGCRSCLS